MFVRFVVGHERENFRALTGIIRGRDYLAESGRIDDYQEERLRRHLDWLNRRLPTPPFSRERWPADAVCWLRDDARATIQTLWKIAGALRESSVPVRVLRTANPGRVLYRDEYQVVASPWRR